MPSCTASGSFATVAGSMLPAEDAASVADPPAEVNTSVSELVRRAVNSAPKTAVPSEAPTSRK